MKNIRKYLASLSLATALFFASHPASANLGSNNFTLVIHNDFTFSTAVRQNYSSIAYNPVSNTVFMAEKDTGEIFEVTTSGSLLRIINGNGLSPVGGTSPGFRAMTWISGYTFAMIMEDHGEMVLVNLAPGVTSVARSGSTIVTLPIEAKFNCQGVAYNPRDGFLYVVLQNKVVIFKYSINLNTLATSLVNTLDFTASIATFSVSDAAFFPRISPHLMLLSDDFHKVIELAISNANGATPGTIINQVSLGLGLYPAIPQPRGLTFLSDGKMFVTTEHDPGAEDEFNIFAPSPAVGNQAPTANAGNPVQSAVDLNGNGSEEVTFNGSSSSDPDGVLIDYSWMVDGIVRQSGYGPTVPNFVFAFPVGTHNVVLTVRDDVRLAAGATVQLTITANPGNLAPSVNVGADKFGTLATQAGNGVVDGNDYLVWQRNYGNKPGDPLWWPAADGNHNGDVDAGDYVVWRDHLGATVASPDWTGQGDYDYILPNGLTQIALNPTVTDDGKPTPPTLGYTWSVLSGPSGQAIFTDANAKNTTAKFAFKGNYVLQLAVFDGQFTSYDTLSVQIAPEGDQNPEAGANVPAQVVANNAGIAIFNVDATNSFDADGDPLTRFLWQEVGGGTLLDTPQKTGTLTLNGLGAHTVRLTVFSNNSVYTTTSTPVDFPVNVLSAPPSTLGGHTFSRSTGTDFPFAIDNVRQGFSGLTYSPTSGTFFMTDKASDEILEFNSSLTLIRAIGIHSLAAISTSPANAQAINWLYDNTFAVTLETQRQLFTVSLPPGKTLVQPSDVVLYNLPLEINHAEGVAFNPRDGFIYIANQRTPFKIYKVKLLPDTATINVVDTIDLTNILLDGDQIGDISFSPRTSPNAMILNRNPLAQKVMEIVISTTVGTPGTVVGSFELTSWAIPTPRGLAFGPDGKMYVVTESAPGPEEHWNVFQPSPTPTIPNNQAPTSNAGPNLVVQDTDGNGSQPVTLSGALSTDPDGVVNWYVWKIQGTSIVISSGTSPVITRTFNVGVVNLTLQVTDGEGLLSPVIDPIQITVLPPAGSGAGSLSAANIIGQVNYVYPGSPSQLARIPYEGPGSATILIVDQLGNTVIEQNADSSTPGENYQEWDFRNSSGQKVASGVYPYRVKNPSGKVSKGKILFINK